MIVKKKPEADVHRSYLLFFNLGMIISLGIVFFIFTRSKPLDEKDVLKKENIALNELDQEVIELEPPPEEKPPPLPPKRKEIELVIKDDDVEVELDEDLFADDSEETEDFIGDEEDEETDQIFIRVEKQPEPKGGMKAFYKFIGENMNYPSQATRMGIEGRVTVEFVVDKDGSITNVKVVRGIGAGCDEEAVRILKKAPKWSPGKQGSKHVRVKMYIPIIFKLKS